MTSRQRIAARLIESLDHLGHRFNVSHTNICLAMDITLGWGPIAADWNGGRTRFLRWFYRWYWNGECPDCHDGIIPWIEVRQEDGSYKRFTDVTCERCHGTGRDPYAP